MHGACAALREPAAEMRVVEPELVAKYVEKGRIRRDLDGPCLAVQLEGDMSGHIQPLIDYQMRLTQAIGCRVILTSEFRCQAVKWASESPVSI